MVVATTEPNQEQVVRTSSRISSKNSAPARRCSSPNGANSSSLGRQSTAVLQTRSRSMPSSCRITRGDDLNRKIVATKNEKQAKVTKATIEKRFIKTDLIMKKQRGRSIETAKSRIGTGYTGRNSNNKGKSKSNDRGREGKKKPTTLICPETGETIYIANATLKDITIANKIQRPPWLKSRNYLVTIPCLRIRQDIYSTMAAVLADYETRTLLPTYGGRHWQCIVTISDAETTSPYFVWNPNNGQLLLAALPNIISKIPNPPKFPGFTASSSSSKASAAAAAARRRRRKIQQPQEQGDSTNEEEVADRIFKIECQESNNKNDGNDNNNDNNNNEDDNHKDNDDVDEQDEETEHEEEYLTPEEVYWKQLQDMEITNISNLAYNERSNTPLPTISMKWISPSRETFRTRSAVYEHAKMLCQNEVLLDRHLYGYTANGCLIYTPNVILKPPSKSITMKVGKIRFERDGIWIVGQEQSWQGKRREEMGLVPQVPTSSSLSSSNVDESSLLVERGGYDGKNTVDDGNNHNLPCPLPVGGTGDMTGSDKVSASCLSKAERNMECKVATPKAARSAITIPALALAAPVLSDNCLVTAAAGCVTPSPTPTLHNISDTDDDIPTTATTRDESSMSDEKKQIKVTLFQEEATQSYQQNANSSISSSSNSKNENSNNTTHTCCVPTFVKGHAPNAASSVASSSLTTKLQKKKKTDPSLMYCLNKDQVDLCYKAAIDHYDQIMRTVTARDLTQELQDGFDLLRERGRGRFDMELPIFDSDPRFHFLSDINKTPWITIVKKILGTEDIVLIHKGVFLSMPGSEKQDYHQDGLHLTKSYQKPCHAVNVFIPLIDLTSKKVGPTEFCLGSHILGNEELVDAFVTIPLVQAGCPILYDYRLGHRGLANTSSDCRPLVYCTYAPASNSSKEFRDQFNFSRKRYRKIGDLIMNAPPTREERVEKRKRLMDDILLERALEASTKVAKKLK